MEKNATLQQEIIISTSDPTTNRVLSKLKKDNLVIKIAPRVYTTNLNDSTENIIRRNLYYILGKLYPNALISHRSAFEFRPTSASTFYLTYKYTKKIKYPGITIHLIQGPQATSADNIFIGGLYASCTARAYLENLQQGREKDNISKCLTRQELEEKLDLLLRTNGEASLNKLRDDAKAMAAELNMESQYMILDRMIGALLSTKSVTNLTSPVSIARALGDPYDSHRVYLFTVLMNELKQMNFIDIEEPNDTRMSYHNFAFFESYFSNYIEGTEFELEDAKQIIDSRTPLPSRNADSHDILGTYSIVSNRKEMSITPDNFDQLIEILQYRHRTLMSARPETTPGLFKTHNNRAGDTHFVDCTLVRGTLKKGFEIYQTLQHPFARAVFMLFFISEVHPFSDGNGRISRIMMNAELTSANQSKIIIPTVFRIDYLETLRLLTRKEEPIKFINAMKRVRDFSRNIQGDDFNSVTTYLTNCNAFKDGEEYILRF